MAPLDPPDPENTAPRTTGVPRALLLFGALTIAGAVTYATPALEPLRPWTDGSAVPFTRFLEFRPPVRETIGGIRERQRASERSEQELLAVAPLPQPIALPTGSRGSAPGVDLALRIAPEDWQGMTAPVQDEHGAMAPFYEALLAVARGENRRARVLFYSDSINGNDRVSQVIREALQARFGDGGKGWVPISAGWQYQRHQDVEWESDNWRVTVLNRGNEPGGRYGLGGVLARNGGPGARARFATVRGGSAGTAVSRYRLFYDAFPGGGDVALSVDGAAPRVVSTAAATPEGRVEDLPVADGPHALEVHAGRGDLHLFGVVSERDRPGVVVDGLMLVGAFTRVLLHWDADHWARQLELREPDLLVFWLGGNDSVSHTWGFDHDRYVTDYVEVLRRARRGSRPLACLVMSVTDSAEEQSGLIESRRRVPRVVAAQREAARRAGCAFFDTHAAMGGRGAARRWYLARPRLITGDFRHPTRQGARVLGSLLYKALLRGYDDWLVGLDDRERPETTATP